MLIVRAQRAFNQGAWQLQRSLGRERPAVRVVHARSFCTRMCSLRAESSACVPSLAAATRAIMAQQTAGWHLAIIAYGTGNLPLALSGLSEAQRMNPHDASAWAYRAFVAWDIGQEQQARVQWKAAVAINSTLRANGRAIAG